MLVKSIQQGAVRGGIEQSAIVLLAMDFQQQAANILEQTASGSPIILFRFNWNAAAEMQSEFVAPLPHATN